MENNVNILRLAEPRKKGIMGIVFSRLLVIMILMGLQIFLFLAFFRWARQYFPHYATVQVLFTACMILYLFNSSMDSSLKLTWMWLIALTPLVGAGMLLYTKLNIGNRTIHKRSSELISATMDTLPRNQSALRALQDDICGTDDLCRYLNRSGCFPVFDRTEVRYYSQGEDCFAAILEALEKAEKYIFLEFFIIEEGYMWGRILDILARKAKAGLDVRVMYDGMCEIFYLPHNYPERLKTLGIKAKAFSPVTPFVSTRYNYRDHRKILVIDGMTAFTGGVNLADEYINRVERFGQWKDTGVMLRGDAVQSFLLMFLQMWSITEKETDFSLCESVGKTDIPANAAGFVLPFADCPLDDYRVGETVYMDILSRANTYVYIMTPYLILDDEMECALRYAAERGVDVRLILPGIPDKKAPYALAKTHYAALIRAGVQICEYTPGFVHAKVCVSDDCKAIVGSINLDYRSLYHHFECAAYMYKTPCIADIKADFLNTQKKCRTVTPDTIWQKNLFYRAAGGILKLVAPLM